MRQLKCNKTEHKTHYMLGVNFYMFRHLIWSFFFVMFRFILIREFCWLKIIQMLHFFNVYWTVHHCDSLRIRDQLDVTSFYVLFPFFYAQHVSDINTFIIRSMRLFYWITTLVKLKLQPATRIPPQPSHTETPNTRRNKNTRPMW